MIMGLDYIYLERGRGPAYSIFDKKMKCLGLSGKSIPGCKFYVRKKKLIPFLVLKLLQVKEEDRCTPFEVGDLADITCEFHREKNTCENPEVKLEFALEEV